MNFSMNTAVLTNSKPGLARSVWLVAMLAAFVASTAACVTDGDPETASTESAVLDGRELQAPAAPKAPPGPQAPQPPQPTCDRASHQACVGVVHGSVCGNPLSQNPLRCISGPPPVWSGIVHGEVVCGCIPWVGPTPIPGPPPPETPAAQSTAD